MACASIFSGIRQHSFGNDSVACTAGAVNIEDPVLGPVSKHIGKEFDFSLTTDNIGLRFKHSVFLAENADGIYEDNRTECGFQFARIRQKYSTKLPQANVTDDDEFHASHRARVRPDRY